MGHSRHFGRVEGTSGLAPTSDMSLRSTAQLLFLDEILWRIDERVDFWKKLTFLEALSNAAWANRHRAGPHDIEDAVDDPALWAWVLSASATSS